MSVITPGTTFANGEQLTATDLNLLVQGASFSQNAVDNDTTILVGSAITVADGGITSAKLDADAVTTSKILNGNVTKAKIEDVADYKVLGNVSGAAAAPQEVTILDEDDMVSNSATALATQQSIKTYVDDNAGGFTPSTYAGGESVTLPNGLIMKMGIVTASVSGTSVSFGAAFPNGVVSAFACPNNGGTLTQGSDYSGKAAVDSLTTSGMNVSCDGSAYWQAFGYE
jgi:hypothetical protein